MPQIDANVVVFLAGIAASLTQLIKGAILSETGKRWLPLIVVGGCSVVGGALAAAYARDIVAGILEGVLAGLSALGVYATGKAVAPSVVNTEGWLKRSKG